MSPTTALVDVEDLRPRVDALLTEHVAGLVPELAAAGAGAVPLAEALGQMLAGGKRLRAAFCYWSWRAHGGEAGSADAEVVLRVGAALELFQAAALFHDDVMDDSDTRRGQPSAHRRFAARHVAQGWSGDAGRFGESAAILLGDLALVASERELVRAVERCPADRRTGAHDVFERMRTEVTVGQYLDLLAQVLPWGEDPVEDEARAREVIVSKSARYSVEHPLRLGAVLAGADDAALAATARYGLPLGEAFQLRDDLLGVFGDPAATGKPAGDDLREGKRTVLVARAIARAQESGDVALVDALRTGLGDRDLDDAACGALAALIGASGAVADVEELIAGLSDRAFTELAAAPLADDGRAMLLELAHAAVDRRA
ncbi:polyprenyl synthetase family protein [Cellulomonas sp. ES6]|uniref:polyprenyl synthetase family protein n=1 Tax=Cellulomonas sp. ES6 TaxID=3039384 RepID=UPI0024B6D812|nr:polyprenyl synthetase family protein [Cellulomonas sp. ES6]WHP18100.1 polyprenyl synthetase family protein [Cellulomonas sp. ES6]